MTALPANGQAASTKWQELGGGNARLVATMDPATSKIEGMIEVRLEEGWKTYWRSPGGSGIPPEFDFSASNSLSVDEIDFPVPQWIEIPSSAFAGYKGTVRFVFDASAGAMDTDIRLNMLIGVCKEICIPAMADFHLSADDLNHSDPRTASEIAMARSDLPAPADTANPPVHPLSLNGQSLIVEVMAGQSAGQPVLYLEGPQEWNLASPKLIEKDDSFFRYSLELPDISGTSPASDILIRYTLVTTENGKTPSGVEGYFNIPK
jgi:DsbC/DsbD-like thiol-disulfide interchange protein